MNIDLDFSELYHSRGDYADKITQKEILSAYDNPNCRLFEMDGYSRKDMVHLACSYSFSKRIILIAGKFKIIG